MLVDPKPDEVFGALYFRHTSSYRDFNTKETQIMVFLRSTIRDELRDEQ
jgi:hypothetical protein